MNRGPRQTSLMKSKRGFHLWLEQARVTKPFCGGEAGFLTCAFNTVAQSLSAKATLG